MAADSTHKRQFDDFVQAVMSNRISRRELIARAAALGVTGAALARLGPAPSASAAPGRAQQVVRLPEREPTVFDPGVTSGGWGLEQLQNLFEGLVGIDQRDGSLVMLEAERMVPNDDASAFRFTLRDNLRWSDGTALNAYDYEYSWKRVLLPETRSDYTSALLPIKNAEEFLAGKVSIDDVGIKAQDAKTLDVMLDGATPYFPLLAATWTFVPVPKHVVEKYKDQWVEAGNMVSNGPYVLKSWSHDQGMVLERNPNYIGTAPTIERAEYTFFSDPVAQALVAFENDELDQAQVQGADLDRVRADSRLSAQLQRFPRSGTYFIVCDTTNAPTSDIRLRQALSMAISRDTLANRILKQEFTPTHTALPPDIPGYNPDAALGEDVSKAQALISQIGSVPTLSFVYDSSSTAYKNVAEYLQGVWKQNLGIDIRLEPMEPKSNRDWFKARATNPFHLYMGFWGSDWGDPANWHNQLFESAADFYHPHWKNDEFDRTVRQARTVTDVQRRTDMYKAAEKILVSDAPIIPLYTANRFYVIKPNVKGVYHYPILGRTFLKYIYVE